MKINDGGPAQCSKCVLVATHRQGHQNLCPKHYRFGQMRALAKRRGKEVPTIEALETISSFGLICPDCNRPMNWLAKDGQSTVASLQHYRDGTISIVCRSCNTRHAFMSGDSYCDMPANHKLCPKCKQVLAAEEFYSDAGRTGSIRRKSWCRSCSGEAHKQWRMKNRDYYNAKQREGRARRNAAD